jgi:hypothetical protein
MPHLLKTGIIASLVMMGYFQPSSKKITTHVAQTPVITSSKEAGKIQVAVLLDVSNSMDGLIDQAKKQLWGILNTMGRARCNEKTPAIEIALYEYGRSNNDAGKGYVKQINPFSNDLDQVSQNLFSLNTNGGEEYCGEVIYTSLDELKWDTSSNCYKVIFIAGNEDFLQGTRTYTEACKKANEKNVIVNTIYCGDRAQGIREHWDLAGECGKGSFTHISQSARRPDIPTPYDSTLISLNSKLNGTYIGYGALGGENMAKQARVDGMNMKAGADVMAARAAVKGNQSLYDNGSWDLVDAKRLDSNAVKKVDMKTLPAELQNKSRAELEVYVKQKEAERSAIQQQIATTNARRQQYILDNEKKLNNGKTENTLGGETEKIMIEQAKRYNIIIQ